MTGDRNRFGVVASIPSEIPKRQFSGWRVRLDLPFLHAPIRQGSRDDGTSTHQQSQTAQSV
jgi:hypothetical protein